MSKISIDNLMEEVVSIQNQINGLNMLLNNKKSILSKYFEKSGKKRIENDECSVYVVERVDVKYDIPRLRKTLDKGLLDEFLDRSYTVVNWNSFLKFLKSKGVKPEELKDFIIVDRRVNEAKLNKLIESGNVELSEIKDCCEATVKKSVALRMKNIDRELKIKDEK